MNKKIKKLIWIFVAISFVSTNIAIASPLKCNSKQPLLCKKAIIEILRKAGLNQYFIEDGDIILTMDTSSPQYNAIKNTKIGIFVHEYNGVKVVTRELTIKDVVGFESADSATKGHHPRYGLNVLTTLATTGSFSQDMPQLVSAKLPGESSSGPVKVTLVVARGTAGEKTIEFVLRKNDRSTALSGMQDIGLLDKHFNLVVSSLNAGNQYTLTADALAKLAGVPVSSLQAGDKTTFEYSFSKATEEDIKHDSLDITSTVAGTANLILSKPTPPAQLALPSVQPKIATKPGATPEEQALLDASNFIGSYTGSKNKQTERLQKLTEIQQLVQASSLSPERKARIDTAINKANEAVKLLGGSQAFEQAIQKQKNNDPSLTAYESALISAVTGNQKLVSSELRSGVLGGNAGEEIFNHNDMQGQKLSLAKNKNKYLQESYQRDLLAYENFVKKQKQVAQQADVNGGLKFYAIDGTSSYASANDFLKAHGQVNKQTGRVKSFNELTRATVNPNHGGSLGYQHFGGSPEFLTSKGNPTPKPYWVHEYQCTDASCSSYTNPDASAPQSSDQGRLFRLEHYSGLERKELETLVMNGNLEGADPNGRLVQKVGNRIFVFEPLHKDPKSTWQPTLLHTYNQAASGSGPMPIVPSDMSGFSVTYQVCGPTGCVGADNNGNLVEGNKETQLGVIVEESGLLKNLQSLGAVGANGKIQGIGSDKDGNIVVFTQTPGSSDLVKFTFQKTTPDQVAKAGLKPISKPVELVLPNQNNVKPQVFTITVSDKDGGRTATRFPGIVTEDKVKTLIDAGVVTKINGQFMINGKQNPDGSITAPVVIKGTEYKFTFHPGIHVGSTAIPTPVIQALNKQQVAKFFQQSSSQSSIVASIKPLEQTNQQNTNHSKVNASHGLNHLIQAHKNISEVHHKRNKAIMNIVDNNSNTLDKNNNLKNNSTISFAHKHAPGVHIDSTNVNQYFVTPASGNQIELKNAPKFIDSDNRQWLCLVSGLGHRISVNSNGKKTVHGHAETLSFYDPAVRDIPGAKHNTSSNCLISINHD